MKEKFKNIFLILGIVASSGHAVLLLTWIMKNFGRICGRPSIWFPAVILLWVFIYCLNAWSWFIIIRDGKHAKISVLESL